MTDFFKIDCYGISKAREFGLCENASAPYSYLDETNVDMWLATVRNVDEDELRFIPVNGCLDIDVTKDVVKDVCTGILIFTDNLVFTELKSPNDNIKIWVKIGAVRLKDTINLFKNNHNIENYQCRVAYLSRKSFVPNILTTTKNKFAFETGIQLFIKHEINVT